MLGSVKSFRPEALLFAAPSVCIFQCFLYTDRDFSLEETPFRNGAAAWSSLHRALILPILYTQR